MTNKEKEYKAIKKAEYKAEGRRRINARQQKRKNAWSTRVRHYGRGSERCPYCDEYMTWCGTCQEWSSDCCVDYGTCQCS